MPGLNPVDIVPAQLLCAIGRRGDAGLPHLDDPGAHRSEQQKAQGDRGDKVESGAEKPRYQSPPTKATGVSRHNTHASVHDFRGRMVTNGSIWSFSSSSRAGVLPVPDRISWMRR
jgi:hypothetical protein